MKKIFLYVFLVLILNTNAYSIVSESYLKPIFKNCLNDAKKNNDDNNESWKFCKCYTNAFNEKFDNQELINFMMKKDEVKTQFIQNEILPMCLGREIVETNTLKLKSLNACRKCNLQGANLSGADLKNADLSGATLCNTITPWGTDNSGC